VDGADTEACWVLNRGDPGLLASLDKLSAAEASASSGSGGASIAAHVDHLRYGLGLILRWRAGENPFPEADWAASWRRTRVSEAEWRALRTDLAETVHRWLEVVDVPTRLDQLELTGTIAGVVHLAYHLGAMRQMDRSIRGPPDPGLGERQRPAT